MRTETSTMTADDYAQRACELRAQIQFQKEQPEVA